MSISAFSPVFRAEIPHCKLNDGTFRHFAVLGEFRPATRKWNHGNKPLFESEVFNLDSNQLEMVCVGLDTKNRLEFHLKTYPSWTVKSRYNAKVKKHAWFVGVPIQSVRSLLPVVPSALTPEQQSVLGIAISQRDAHWAEIDAQISTLKKQAVSVWATQRDNLISEHPFLNGFI